MINAIKLENSNKQLSRLVYLRIILITLFSLGIFGCGGKDAGKGSSRFPQQVVNFFSSQAR
jgi:hypothetical protein